MLGHCAQSVVGALPGGSGAPLSIIRQVSLTDHQQSGIVPEEAAFAFFEVVAQGGYSTGSSVLGGGGGGSDAIVAVIPGRQFSAQLDYVVGNAANNAANASITYDGSVVVSAVGGAGTSNGTGKYPGSNGRGGGRLSGTPAPTGSRSFVFQSGHGCGAVGSSNGGSAGGRSVGQVTFFRTREDAIAFANSVYGGNWTP